VKTLPVVCLLLLTVVLSGCGTYAGRIQKPRSLFEAGDYDDAIKDLKVLAETQDNDELLYLMDLGMVYHTAGRYQEAIATFQKADKLAEIKDYTSLTQESASILLSDDVKPYKGEDFEKIMINMYLAIDYALSHQYDESLVECRRVNHKIDMMISQGHLPYEQNGFAKYLDAVLFEARGEYNDAFVDYRQLLKWEGNATFPYLGVGLLRMASKLQAEQEFDEYHKRFPQITNYKIAKGQGEIVILLEQGKAPIKVPHPEFKLLPKFRKRYYSSDHVTIRDAQGTFSARSYPLYNIEETAIAQLDHRITLIATKKIAGLALKVAAGYAVEKATKSPLAGFLTTMALSATDHADLRSWTTLPATLQLARVTVPAGKHTVLVDVATREGYNHAGTRQFNVDVKPGEIVFINYRTPDGGGY